MAYLVEPAHRALAVTEPIAPDPSLPRACVLDQVRATAVDLQRSTWRVVVLRGSRIGALVARGSAASSSSSPRHSPSTCASAWTTSRLRRLAAA